MERKSINEPPLITEARRSLLEERGKTLDLRQIIESSPHRIMNFVVADTRFYYAAKYKQNPVPYSDEHDLTEEMIGKSWAQLKKWKG